MSTGGGYCYHYRSDGVFCVTVGPVTRTPADIMAQSVKGASC